MLFGQTAGRRLGRVHHHRLTDLNVIPRPQQSIFDRLSIDKDAIGAATIASMVAGSIQRLSKFRVAARHLRVVQVQCIGGIAADTGGTATAQVELAAFIDTLDHNQPRHVLSP